MCLRAKFRGSPKALITKDKKLLIRPIQGGIVTSLKIIVIGMGDRGSKSIIGGYKPILRTRKQDPSG